MSPGSEVLLSSRNMVRKASQALMSFGAAALVIAAGICFTGYPPTTAAAAPTGLSALPSSGVARFASAKTIRTAKAPAKKKVTKKKVKKLVAKTPWQTAKVSWYGPGFYGNTMAGGGKLRQSSMVVAHRSMPFGTKIQFSYKGRKVIAVVKDRGPYISGRTFDLGPGTARKLKFSGVGNVRWRIVK